MLQGLSGQPRPYFYLMPTKDHRQAYMEILAWLMRYGWVTQVRTFGWVLVSREVKGAVAAQLEVERRQQQQQGQHSGPRLGRDRSVSGSSARAGPPPLDRSAETLLDGGGGPTATDRVPSPLLRPPPHDDQRPAGGGGGGGSAGASPRLRASSDAASVSSDGFPAAAPAAPRLGQRLPAPRRRGRRRQRDHR
jgi:hypothetical protein